jgi:hypothetical protein
VTTDPWPERMDVDVGYRDPWDPRDDVAEPPDPVYPEDIEPLEVGALRHQLRGAVEALRELVDAGEPFIGDAFPSEEMTGNGLRLFNRWQAAMNDARTALGGQ